MSAMAADIIIRMAGSGDLDALMALEEASFAMDRLSRRAMRYALRSPAQVVLAAWRGQKLAAAAIFGFRAGSFQARLSSIAVAGDQAGKGVGRALLQAAEDIAIQRGARAMRLEVRADNSAGIALYERTGYRLSGRTEDYYEDGTAALRFIKDLA